MPLPAFSQSGGKVHAGSGSNSQLWWALAAASVPVVVAGALWIIRFTEHYVPYEVQD